MTNWQETLILITENTNCWKLDENDVYLNEDDTHLVVMYWDMGSTAYGCKEADLLEMMAANVRDAIKEVASSIAVLCFATMRWSEIEMKVGVEDGRIVVTPIEVNSQILK